MRKKTLESFLKKATSVHGGKYEYNNINYINGSTKICIKCPQHGDFYQRPNDHERGNGCPVCSGRVATRPDLSHIEAPNGSKVIPLTKGKYALVDEEAYEVLMRYAWHFTADGYACHNKLGRMHRYITKCPDGLDVDHKNMNKLDNRKSNLRISDRTHNNANKTARKGTSIYKGVSWHNGAKKWRSVIGKNKKYYHIGFFENEIDAAIAYDIKALDLFGEFACTNFSPARPPNFQAGRTVWTD